MPWMVMIHRSARKVLRRLDQTTRHRITEKIRALGDNPDDPALDVRPLFSGIAYRLRVGGWRIIFLRKEDVRVISIERIRSRGKAYK
ncbi:MAG: type II toxin-antitoxin system RelE/ParE family toxin [Gammaproteobacteria bacterium]